MYDDLLGKPKKAEKGVVNIQEIEWDDEKKEMTVTSESEIDVEIDEDGNITAKES